MPHLSFPSFFFFNDTATTEIYTLSLHDALPILTPKSLIVDAGAAAGTIVAVKDESGNTIPNPTVDRKSTRLNSSHGYISYAVFCLKKKKKSTSTILLTTAHINTQQTAHSAYTSR